VYILKLVALVIHSINKSYNFKGETPLLPPFSQIPTKQGPKTNRIAHIAQQLVPQGVKEVLK
jgi:hypothetical protein